MTQPTVSKHSKQLTSSFLSSGKIFIKAISAVLSWSC